MISIKASTRRENRHGFAQTEKEFNTEIKNDSGQIFLVPMRALALESTIWWISQRYTLDVLGIDLEESMKRLTGNIRPRESEHSHIPTVPQLQYTVYNIYFLNFYRIVHQI